VNGRGGGGGGGPAPPPDEGENRLVNYRWRHTAISTLLMLGVDVATVAELTGTSPDMIYKFYGHLLDEHLRGAAEKLMGRKSARK
jgi:integrase